MSELADAHACEDCPVDCDHPDHLGEGPIPDLWQLLLGHLVEEGHRERELAYGPVWL